MPLSLSIATEAEADPVAVRIGDIHMAAFHSNGMLLAQFPTPAVREGLRKSIVRKTIDDIKDVKTTVVLVRDGDEIISFAKWVDPVKEGEDYEEPPWHWPEGTRHDILDEWTEKVESASERVLRNTAHYRLNFLATDPPQERRGAGTMLVRWGTERAIKDKVPAYMESTAEAGPLYERQGFKAVEKISMLLEGIGKDGASVNYEETCYIFRPEVSL